MKYSNFFVLIYKGEGRGGLLPAQWAEAGGAWGCSLQLPEPLCSESALQGLHGGHDTGYSFHIGFMFLSIYQKNEASHDNCV